MEKIDTQCSTFQPALVRVLGIADVDDHAMSGAPQRLDDGDAGKRLGIAQVRFCVRQRIPPRCATGQGQALGNKEVESIGAAARPDDMPSR